MGHRDRKPARYSARNAAAGHQLALAICGANGFGAEHGKDHASFWKTLAAPEAHGLNLMGKINANTASANTAANTAAERRLPSKKTNQGAHGKAIRGNDLYPTPPELISPFLSVEPLPKLLWEPCAGMGHMVHALIQAGHTVIASDITDYTPKLKSIPAIAVADFFDYRASDVPEGASCIITNPPFSMNNRFVRHALDLVPKVCVLNRLAFLEGRARADIIDRHLSRVYPFIERPPMMHRWSQTKDGAWQEWSGKKSGSAMPFAWFVFERDRDPSQGSILRRLSWRRSIAPPIAPRPSSVLAPKKRI